MITREDIDAVDAVERMVNNMSEDEIKERVGKWHGRLPGALGVYEQDCILRRYQKIRDKQDVLRRIEYDKKYYNPEDYYPRYIA